MFQNGSKSDDEPPPGAPKTSAMKVNMTKVHDLVLAEHRLKARDIAEAIISRKKYGQPWDHFKTVFDAV